MAYSKPAAGMPVVPYVANLPMWNDIVDMLHWWRDSQAQLTPTGFGKCLPIGHNTTATTMQAGELAYIGSVLQPGADTLPIDNMQYAPILELQAPVWNTAMDKVVLLHKPIIADGVDHVFGLTTIPSTGSLIKPTDKYVMMDPVYPNKLRSADAGMFGLVGSLTDSVSGKTILIVDVTQSQPLWRYRLTSNFASGLASAVLVRLDGDDYSTTETITLTDKAGLCSHKLTGETGYCLHVGKYFIPVPHPEAKIFIATSGIPARAGTTAGDEVCEIVSPVGAGLTATGITDTVYNVSDQAIPAGSYVIAEPINGSWYVGASGGGGGSISPEPVQRAYCVLGPRPEGTGGTRYSADPREPTAIIDSASIVRLSSDPFSIDPISVDPALSGDEVSNTLQLTGIAGDGAIIEYNYFTGAYFLVEVFPQQQRRLWVQLAADKPLGLGATVSCNPVTPIGNGAMPSNPFNAIDIFNVAINAKAGHKALVEYDFESSSYRVIESEHVATRVKCTLAADFDSTPADFSVTVVKGMDGIDPTGPLTVTNRYNWEFGKSGDNVEVLYDSENGEWYPSQCEAPEDPAPTYVN